MWGQPPSAVPSLGRVERTRTLLSAAFDFEFDFDWDLLLILPARLGPYGCSSLSGIAFTRIVFRSPSFTRRTLPCPSRVFKNSGL